nr:ATP-binding protein [uncultured Prevotella sp.]
MTQLIGRDEEQSLLKKYIDSDHSEFIAIYGRRRVGKTFLVTETFGKQLDFDMTGVIDGNKDDQMVSFNLSLKESGYEGERVSNWYDAFEALKEVVRKKQARIVPLSFL